LFEGETEEQALPIFFKNYFGFSNVEFGVDFIGVSGNKNYLPFIRFAENLGIPWIILSDADNDTPDVIDRQFVDSGTRKMKNDVIVFLNVGNDFEKQLICDGFQDEIRKAILYLDEYKNDQHRLASESKRIEEVNRYNDSNLYSYLINHKTMAAPVVADFIVKSKKSMSPFLLTLFRKIKALIDIKEESL